MICGDFVTDKRYMTIVHFNRIEMQRGGEHVWTVHNRLGCFNVRRVILKTEMETRYRPGAQQPRAFFKGPAVVTITKGVATLS